MVGNFQTRVFKLLHLNKKRTNGVKELNILNFNLYSSIVLCSAIYYYSKQLTPIIEIYDFFQYLTLITNVKLSNFMLVDPV